MTVNRKLEQMSNTELASFLIDVIRRMALHYGFWFNEVQHQLGLEEALRTEEQVSKNIFPLAIKRLSQVLGSETGNGLPEFIIRLPRERLLALVDTLSVIWLANDGIWFQTVESRQDMFTGKRCNDTCWTRFSPLEADMIKSFLDIPERSGLEGLAAALDFRLYARINKQTVERDNHSLFFKMVSCRVQDARKRKGLEDYPCKSAGLVEYSTFARAIDPRIKTECLGCPPDKHPAEWSCAWRFYI